MVDYVARPYEVKFKRKAGPTTSKFYANRSDRDREVARLRDEGRCKWIKPIDHK
jgi:hypothetical protein